MPGFESDEVRNGALITWAYSYAFMHVYTHVRIIHEHAHKFITPLVLYTQYSSTVLVGGSAL